METTKFELPSIYSVITPKVIESSDLEVFNKLDFLYSSMDLLKSSMDTIEEGAKNPNNDVQEKSRKLRDRIKNL